MGKVTKSKSLDTSRSRLIEQFLYYDHQACERPTQADQENLLREERRSTWNPPIDRDR